LRRLALAAALAAVVLLVPARPASATFHLISVREVYPGGASNDSYVVLQAYSPGQNLVSGHTVTAYDATGGQIGSLSFSSNVSNSADQMTILVADSSYASGFPGGPAPDATMGTLDLAAAGGAVCWESLDCVSWGNFSGTTTPSAGSPASPAGVTVGKALRRSIAAGCSTMLEAADDTDSSLADFSEQTPSPRANSSPIVETPCNPPPTAVIDAKPPAKTKATSAAFTFHSNPAGAEFECRLDVGAFAACNSGSIEYPGPLAEGPHSFMVRAKNGNGTGVAASHGWEVDNTPPMTTISNPKPPNPNSGNGLTFKFSADESGVTFVCSLAKGAEPDSFSGCSGSGKSYSALTDGSYTFKVHGTDSVGNVGADATYAFDVDTSLGDTTPPETTLTSKPPDPSDSSTAEFTYESSEPGSTFECKLDATAFAPCAATGIVYTGLGEGGHTFQVRATDESANTDQTPAGYSFSVVLSASPPVEALQPRAPDPPPPVRRRAPPWTKIVKAPKGRTADRTPTFRFRASVRGATFVCKLDGKRLKRCHSPLTTKKLRFGRHKLQVAAVAEGLRDKTPAVASFKVVRRR
jgi:hypothetical protein